jgi:hypothetical protein
MSYTSYSHLPYLSTHAEALDRFNKTTPIRGSNPVRFPLGRRSDSNKFTIDHNPTTGDVVLSIYSQPLITFHADNTVTIGVPNPSIRRYRWSSCDSYFIAGVLGRYIKNVRTDMGRLVIEARDGQKFVLPNNASMRFTYTIDNTDQPIYNRTFTLTPLPESLPVLYVPKINRKTANEVRARYGDFYRYMKGMIGVRKQTYTDNYYDYKNDEEVVDTYDRIEFAEEEIVAVVPTTNTHSRKLPLLINLQFDQEHPTLTRNPLDKPAITTPVYVRNEATDTWEQVDSREPYDAWLAATQAFLTKVRGHGIDKDGNPLDETESFYQAFVYLAHFAQQGNRRFLGPENFSLDPKQISRAMDEIIFKWHSEEVIEVVPAKEGTVPTAKYLKWVTRDKD